MKTRVCLEYFDPECRYQEGLVEKKKGSDFIFDYADRLCFICHNTNLNYDWLYIKSPDWKGYITPKMNMKNVSNLQYPCTKPQLIIK